MYPEGTTKVYSNFTPRSMSHLMVPDEFKDNKIVWVGLQAFLHDLSHFWDETFFDRDIDDVVDEFEQFVRPFVGPNGVDSTHIRKLHALHYLPLRIKTLPEGSRVDIGVPVLTITNTVDHAFWLPNFMETWMSCEIWKTPTSATIAHAYRRIIDKYADITGGNKDFVAWQGHDFSVRGMSGIYDAAKSGLGHLLSFTGTDNLPAVKLINDVYEGGQTFVGGSVPATEHSVMCAGGKEHEVDTFRRLVNSFPKGVVSIVSDTWDFWNVVGGETSIAAQLKQEILSRTSDQLGLAKVVFRPDSGDPVKILCGYKCWDAVRYGAPTVRDMTEGGYTAVQIRDRFYRAGWSTDTVGRGQELSAAEVKGAVECLWDIFGGTVNEKGYRTLNQRVGLIYGDSITPQRAVDILANLAEKGFASDNVVFGIGSFTFQYQTRDTLGFAMKATYVEIDGQGVEIFKDPKTDSGTKRSARGLLQVLKTDTGFELRDQVSEDEAELGELKVVFVDGAILRRESITTIRDRLAEQR